MIAIALPRCLSRLLPARAAAPSRTPLPDAQAETERVLGCGWFDSSHDLQQGLRVREHASVDAVAADMPLGTWLEWHIAGHSLTGQQ